MTDPNTPPYTERTKRKSIRTAGMIAGLFVFAAAVFGILFGAGNFLAGS